MKVYRVRVGDVFGVCYDGQENRWKNGRTIYFSDREKAKKTFPNAETEEVDIKELPEDVYINF